MVDSTAKRIETAIGLEPEGKIVFSTDYAELGTPEAIKKSLIRLCERNVIVRLAHGIYYKPKFDNELGLGMLLPSLDDLAQAIAKRDHSRIGGGISIASLLNAGATSENCSQSESVSRIKYTIPLELPNQI